MNTNMSVKEILDYIKDKLNEEIDDDVSIENTCEDQYEKGWINGRESGLWTALEVIDEITTNNLNK